MEFVILLAIGAVLLFGFSLAIFWLGGGFTHEIKGGPVIRARKRAGIVRYPE